VDSRPADGALRENLRNWWDVYLWIIVTAGALFAIYDPLDKFLEKWVKKQAGLEQAHLGEDHVPALLSLVILIGVFCLVGAAIMLYRLARIHRNTARTARAKDLLFNTFLKTIDAADEISRGMFPSTGQTVKHVVSCKQIYTLYDNGDCYFTEDLVVDAGTADVHFMEKTIGGEDEAAPAEYPADIGLKIASLTPGREVRYLITKNQPRFKSFAIFFLPVIPLGARDHRTIRTEYYWKGLLKGLAIRPEPIELEVKTSAPPNLIEYEFWAKPGIGELHCENVGGKPATGTDSMNPVSDGKGMKGWKYEAKKTPPGHVAKFKLELR
jgi:hypothetical protein